MDYLEIDGEVIRYNINPELLCCKYDKCGELVKAQRMILFFNSSGDAIGSGPYYDDIDKVTCILPFVGAMGGTLPLAVC